MEFGAYADLKNIFLQSNSIRFKMDKTTKDNTSKLEG